MALTNQPYYPMYVDDWMNNSKLKMCSLQAHGLMISIMCILHKEPTYGKLLLKQRFKQSDNQIENFASQIARLSSFDSTEIKNPLTELIQEKVLKFEEDFLICSRMVKDAEISVKRANAGKNGGASNKYKNFAYTNNKANQEANIKPKEEAKSEANPVNVNVIENVIVNEDEKGKGGMEEKPKIEDDIPVLIFPFDTETFKTHWQLWIAFRLKTHKFKYADVKYEQIALNQLYEKSDQDEKTAIKMMNEAIAGGWKGLFKLKPESNGKSQYQQKSSEDFVVNR